MREKDVNEEPTRQLAKDLIMKNFVINRSSWLNLRSRSVIKL